MKSIFWVKLVGVIFGFFVQKATYAWNWPNTEPVDQTRVVHITADRAVLPSDRYSIFSREIVAYKQNDNEYGLGNFVCLSSSDPATGACYDTWINKWRPNDTAIRLRLTERRTRVSRILTLIGNQYPLWNNNGYCSDIGKRGLGGLKEVTAKGKASMEINWICGLIKEVLRTCHSGGYGRETSYWTMFDGPLNWRDTRCIFALTSQTGRTFRCGFRSLHKHIHK